MTDYSSPVRPKSAVPVIVKTISAIAFLFLTLSFSLNCDNDCIQIEQNTNENVLSIFIHGTQKGTDQITLKDSNGVEVFSDKISLRDDLTDYYIDLHSVKLSEGTYTVSFSGINQSTTFSIK